MSPKAIHLRETIPVLGTGFNHWLLRDAAPPAILTDWWELLRTVAWRENLFAAEPSLAAVLAGRGDPTYAWESIIHAAVVAHGSEKRKAASVHEGDLLETLASLISRETPRLKTTNVVQERARRFFEALGVSSNQQGLDCDIISLNFDRVLQDSWVAANAAPDPKPIVRSNPETPPGKKADKPISWGIEPRSFEFQGAGGKRVRMWYPHGECTHPQTIVAGNLRYARATARVLEYFAGFRARLAEIQKGKASTGPRLPRKGRQLFRSNPDASKDSWLGVAIDSPLLLLGVGLTRSESDLWAFLHLRARNHANVPPHERPPIYRLTSQEERPEDRAHWTSVPPGIRIEELNLGKTWGEAWENLLNHLSLPSRRFP